jgi:hypothetical protein
MITNILMKVGLMSMATAAALVIIVGTVTAMHSEQTFAQNKTTTIISEPVKVQTVQTDFKNVQTDFKNLQTDLKNLQTDMTSPGIVGPAPTTTKATTAKQQPQQQLTLSERLKAIEALRTVQPGVTEFERQQQVQQLEREKASLAQSLQPRQEAAPSTEFERQQQLHHHLIALEQALEREKAIKAQSLQPGRQMGEALLKLGDQALVKLCEVGKVLQAQDANCKNLLNQLGR